jgi:hypothetical protein
MFRLGDVWKIIVLVALSNFAPPIMWGVGKAQAQGLTPGGVPYDTQIGSFINRGDKSGYYAWSLGGDMDYIEFLIAPPSAYVGRVPPATGTIIWYLPDLGEDQLSAAAMAHSNMHAGPLGIYHGKQWYRDATTSPAAGTAAAKLAPYGTESAVTKYIKEGWGWDTDGDGDVDADDYADIFDGDMDDDGTPDATDADMDGDGEHDRYEKVGTVDNALRRREGDPYQFIDRDGDSLPDFLDEDGDGVLNWIEQRWVESMPPEYALAARDDDLAPDGWEWLYNDNPHSPYYRLRAVTDFVGLGDPLADSDNDGAPNWWEQISGTDMNDRDRFPDHDGDGVLDWLVAPVPGSVHNPIQVSIPKPTAPTTVVTGGGTTGGGTPPTVPTPPAPTPAKPFQMVWPASSGSSSPTPSGQASAGTPITDSNATTAANAFTGIGSGSISLNPGFGASFTGPTTGGTGGGSGGGPGGGSGGEGGDGDYQVVEQPKGTSTAYLGVGGGSWRFQSGNDLGLQAGAEYVHAGLGASDLRNAMGIAPSGVDLSHVAVLSMKWIDGTTKTWNVPLLPDLTTPSGQTADKVRYFLRLFAAIWTGYFFIGKVWLAIRTG